MKLIRDEAGQMLVFTAFLMCCLFGFMALAIDVGVLTRAQRKAQTAADSAAIAGGLEYFYHGSTNAATVARAAAGNNGVSDTLNQVAVHIPPGSGWHTGSGYLEVVVTQPNPTIFMSAFGGLFSGANNNLQSVAVSARAVAGIVPGQSCLYVLDPSDPGSLSIQGGGTVKSPDCSITIDSSSTAALCITGNAADSSFETPGVYVVNGQAKDPPCNKLYPGASTSGSAGGNPFANTLSFPNPNDPSGNVCNSTNTVPATYTTISNSATSGSNLSVSQLANYTTNTNIGGLTTESNHQYDITCFAGNNVTLSGVTIGPSDSNHLYLFEHGLVLSGSNTVNGTIDLNDGMFCQGSLSGGGCSWNSAGGSPKLTINAPADVIDTGTSYPFNGFAFLMPPTDTTSKCANSYGGPNYGPTKTPNSCMQMQFGSQDGLLTGLIYAPGAAISLQDSGGSIGVAGIISDALYVNGDLTVTNYNFAHPDSPLAHVALVE
jgi:hypothetical protein